MKGDNESITIGVLSGHFCICVAHSIKDMNGFINVYTTTPDEDSRMLDHAEYSCIYKNDTLDIAILKIAENVVVPFKNLSHLINADLKNEGMVYIHPSGCVKMDGYLLGEVDGSYTIGTRNLHATGLSYKTLQGEGLCGSLIFSERVGIRGMHVAGNEETKVGFAQIWSPEVRQEIKDILQGDSFISKHDFQERLLDSGIKINKNFHASNPKTTRLIPSPLHGVFPVEKEPIDPVVNGPHTVKDSLKVAMGRVKDVDPKLLNVAREMLDACLQDYDVLSEFETIKGTENLASMKKDTATGIGLAKEREVYIDFENGKLTEEGRILYDGFLSKLDQGTLDIEDIISKEAIKDELRALGKNKFPRTFRVVPLPINFLLKQVCGNLAEFVAREKWFLGIMLQFNPYIECTRVYETLKGRNILALDVKFWDKNMVVQVLKLVSDIVVSKCKDNLWKKRLSIILSNLAQNYVAANDDVFWLTHSLASGSWVTALFNSLVQLCYIRMWHYQETKRPLQYFFDDVRPFILGDDLICGIKDDAKLSSLNAFTMQGFYRQIGLDMTSSTKGEITTLFENWDKVTFLKRRFVFNRELGRVMGVLADETLLSSISWLDSSKDMLQVMQDKITVFQIEAYLHERREELLQILENKCKKEKVQFVKLPDTYLKYLFEHNTIEYSGFNGQLIE